MRPASSCLFFAICLNLFAVMAFGQQCSNGICQRPVKEAMVRSATHVFEAAVAPIKVFREYREECRQNYPSSNQCNQSMSLDCSATGDLGSACSGVGGSNSGNTIANRSASCGAVQSRSGSFRMRLFR
jgi:hypothetical protein